MFLRRVTITGFKSFANKTVIDFERGITGVVGPNGSGKSNLADAVRWALGEQGKSRLRLGERDEVVFAGSDQRAKASFAEVVLVFDNQDGAFGIDLTEVEIARRMYRSGETDYRLAGRSARLSDIQALLAGAGVGASSYAVIGQGMIDSILMSSPAERKLLFDEAAGIRAPELGREAALRKLSATATNLTRLRDIAAELAPRLGSLQQAVAAADERATLKDSVRKLRQAVIAARHELFTAELAAADQELASLGLASHSLRHDRHSLEHTQARAQRAREQIEERRLGLTARLSALEQQRDQAAEALAAARAASAAATQNHAAMEQCAAQLEAASAQSAAAAERLSDMKAQIASNADSAGRATKAVDKAGREVTAAQAALVALRDGTGDGARDQYLDHALSILKTLALGLGTAEYNQDRVRLLVHKAGRLLSHATRGGAAELLTELKTAQKQLEAAMAHRETAVEHQTNISITGRSLDIDAGYLEEELQRLKLSEAQLRSEYDLLAKVNLAQPDPANAERSAEADLAEAARQLEEERDAVSQLGAAPNDITAASELLSQLTRVREALAGHSAALAAAHERRYTATEHLALTKRQAEEWQVATTQLADPRPLAQLTDLLARAEAQLEARTGLYEDQLSEYEAVTQRQAELTDQIADLEAAERDLRSLVGELDTLIRVRFKDNFQALAVQFKHYFGRLFEGGSASLELAESDDGSYGIIIKASPKGKRLASIAALSGGERALAGVALVAAIMRVNPSPFVVLDEIDAALDESNSGRLASILTELEEYSQLIVITHNRQTMKAAKVLFGVTMNEHHVSRLISMRLEQATQLAAR